MCTDMCCQRDYATYRKASAWKAMPISGALRVDC